MSDEIDHVVLGCVRVADLHFDPVGSVETTCGRCGERVVVSVASLADTREITERDRLDPAEIVCLPCIRRDTPADTRVQPITPRVRAELLAFGISEAELDRLDRAAASMPAIEL